MATAPITIAPVLTPRTVTALESALRESDRAELASALEGLRPFLERVVERFFAPLTSSPRRNGFRRRFNRLSHTYEPFRLALMIRLLQSLQNKDLLGFYGRVVRDMLGPLLIAADEMDMAPQLVAAMVSDHLQLFSSVAAQTSPAQRAEMSFEWVSSFVDCLHRATRFDYGLTAIFLVLEGSIAEPSDSTKVDLLTECKKSLSDLAKALVRVLDIPDGNEVLSRLQSSKLQIAGTGKRLRTVPRISEQSVKGLAAPRRQTEIDWIKKNTEQSEQYRGKWIVVENDELIASDRVYSKARAIAKQRGIKRPFIVFVPSTPGTGFMGT